MRDKREPVAFEVYEPGVYLHGTKAALGIGELLLPGHESNFEEGRVMNYAYFTATLDAAIGEPNSPPVKVTDGSIWSSRLVNSKTTPTSPTRSSPEIRRSRFVVESR